MLQWVSQVDYTPLEDGDASFHPLALRWLRAVEEREIATGEDQWPLVAKFLNHLEASADAYWHVPTFELTGALPEVDDLLDDEEEDDGAEIEQEDEESEELPWEDEEPDERFSAAYEEMIYRDSTDDGYEGDIIDEYTDGTEYELEEEAQRLGQHLEFLATIARMWRHVAIGWSMGGGGNPDRRDLLDHWCKEAATRHDRLLELAETVNRYTIPHPSGSYDSMVEYDRQRMIKDSLLEHIIMTCVETADAGRLIVAASQPPCGSSAVAGLSEAGPAPADPSEADQKSDGGECPLDDGASVDVLRGVLHDDVEMVTRNWPRFVTWLADQELLYVPLGKGGRPVRIVRARRLGQLLDDLLGWLPRLGLIRETSQLLDLAQTMESDNPVGPGAVSEYDRLFMRGYQAIVRALVASADDWEINRAVDSPNHDGSQSAHPTSNIQHPTSSRPTDMMLVEALQDLTESQLNRWLAHSRTLRLSVVERLGNDEEWKNFVDFIQRYGADLFTQKFLNLSNLRAILHQRPSLWLSNLEQSPEAEDMRLITELGGAITHEHAARYLTLVIESIVENYREYRDYNTTTTHSDHGELLFTLVDFLRLRAAYDRVAWNLRPVVMAHEVLVRHNRSAAAELWQQALAERTAETADGNLARFDALCNQYGIRLPSVAERLGERFTRPLAIDRVRALVGPAIAAADTGDAGPITALKQEIANLAQEPAGAGLDLPDWLEALEDEVTAARCKRRHRQADADGPRQIVQVRLSWDDWQQQIAEDAK
jgi:hypothetical protein